MNIVITAKQTESFINSLLYIGEDYVQIVKAVTEYCLANDIADYFDESEIITLDKVWQLQWDNCNIEDDGWDKERCEMEFNAALNAVSCFGLIDGLTVCKLQGKFESLMEYSYSDDSYEKWAKALETELRSVFSKYLG